MEQTIRTNAKKQEDKKKDELAKLTADMNGAIERFDAETCASGLDQGALFEQCMSLVTKFCVLTTTTGLSGRSDQRRYSKSSIASTPDAETGSSLPPTIYLQPEVKAEDLYRLLVDKFIVLITANSSSSSSTSLFLSKMTSASTTALGHQQRATGVTGGSAFSTSRSNLVAINSVSQMGSGVQSPLARPTAVNLSSRNLNMNSSPVNSRPSSGSSSANNSQHNSVALRSATKASPLDAAHRISVTPSTSSVSIEGSTHISHLATPNLAQRSAANNSGQLLTTANPAFRTGSNPNNLNNLNRSGQSATGSAVIPASNSIAANNSVGGNPSMMSVSFYVASTSASGGVTHNAVTATASSPALRPATGSSQLQQPGSVRLAHQSSKQTTILPSAMGNVRGSGFGSVSSNSSAATRSKGSSREQLNSRQEGNGNSNSNNKPSPVTAAEATCL